MSFYNRRKFLATTAGAAGRTRNGRCARARRPSLRIAASATSGGAIPERDKRTFAVIDIFNGKNAGIVVEGETLGFADYFTKLTTQIAGGNMPDVIQMGYGVMFEYINNGAIVPLDDYVGKSLDISKLDKSALDAGSVDGKLYAVSIGANSHVAMYNTRLYEAAGIKVGENFDPFGWTYDDVARIGKAIKDATGIPGTDDNTADYQNFSDFVGQKGATMFTDGEYSVPQDVVEEYWATWKMIRDAGATVPAEETAALAGVADLAQTGLVTGKSATSYAWSNQLVGAQALMQDKLGAAMYPNTPAMVPGLDRPAEPVRLPHPRQQGCRSGHDVHERLRQRSRHDQGAGPRARHPEPVGRACGPRAAAHRHREGLGRLLRRHPGQDRWPCRRRRPRAPTRSNRPSSASRSKCCSAAARRRKSPPTSCSRPRTSSRGPDRRASSRLAG